MFEGLMRKLRALAQRDAMNDELDREVRYHIERWGVGVEFKGLSAQEEAHLAALVGHYGGAVGR